jgi:hypothetical protein
MRRLIAPFLLCLLALPVGALAHTPSDPQTLDAFMPDDDTPRAAMDSAGPSEAELRARDEREFMQADLLNNDKVAPARVAVYRPMVEVCEAVTQSAKNNNLPVSFFIRLLHQESGFRPDVVSSAGAQGVAQFMPEVSARMGVDNPFDPLQAIPASARLLRDLLSKFGNLGLAAAAYNAGPKRIQTWLAAKKKKAQLPKETQGYVRIITGKPVESWKSAKTVPDTRPLTHAPCKVPEEEQAQLVAQQREEAAAHSKLAALKARAVRTLKQIPALKTRMAAKPLPAMRAVKRGKGIAVAMGVKKGPRGNPESVRRAGKARAVKVASVGRGT